MTVTTELVLARHGEAVCNTAGIVGGERGCTGLTHQGRQQANLLAARLAIEHQQRPFDAFYATPRRRVRETAEIIAAALPLVPVIIDDLRGPDHGTADGRSWQEIKTAFGGPPQHRPEQPYATGSETWNQYLDRATGTLRGILDQWAGHRILIVAHGETIEAAHVLLLNLPQQVRRAIAFGTDHGCIARWQEHVNRFDRHVWTLAAHNDISHLDAANR
jgi:probable phosphoglycerate mutase